VGEHTSGGRFVSQPIRVGAGATRGIPARVELVFHGIDQSGPSYEARGFLNNPDADAATPLTAEHGYAGSVHVYGYGQWRAADPGAPPPGQSRAPMTRTLDATEAVRRALAAGPDLTVTVVAVTPGQAPRRLEPGLRLDRVSVTTS